LRKIHEIYTQHCDSHPAHINQDKYTISVTEVISMMICRCSMACTDYCNLLLAPVRWWGTSSRRTGHARNLRHSLNVRVSVSAGSGCPMTSGWQHADAPHQRTSDCDDRYNSGRCHDVEAAVELHDDFAGRAESSLGVVACQLRRDEVRQAGRHYAHARCKNT